MYIINIVIYSKKVIIMEIFKWISAFLTENPLILGFVFFYLFIVYILIMRKKISFYRNLLKRPFFSIGIIFFFIAYTSSIFLIQRKTHLIQEDEISQFFEEDLTLLSPVEVDSSTIDFEIHIQMLRKEMKEEINKSISDIHSKIQDINKRFPPDKELDKYASVNDAILSQQINNLAQSITMMESRLLTKWDIAITVFSILGALGIIVGLIQGLLTMKKEKA